MKTRKLGRTGLDVTPICLGCMTYGEPTRGAHPWTLGEEASRPLIRRALELGFNFFDTSNSYSAGSSEEILGRALADFANRDEVVVATKVFFPLTSAPNSGGLSRKAIFQAIDASLRRLRMDYVDLYQIHRWDYATPIEETMEALHDVVKAGKARYLGASSMAAYQFAKALHVSETHGWSRFVSMQNHYNLVYREEEREMMPLCASEGIAVIPWSPLARGRLTRPADVGTPRVDTDVVGKGLYDHAVDADRRVIERVQGLASRRGISAARIALAWVASKPFVSAPIVGASRAEHLDDAVAALEVSLDAEELAFLEEPYVPHAVAGFS